MQTNKKDVVVKFAFYSLSPVGYAPTFVSSYFMEKKHGGHFFVSMKDLSIQPHGPLFSTYAEEFSSLSQERMGLARRVRRIALLEEGFDLAEKITSFNAEVKKPFIHDLLQEIDKAMKINDSVLLAFDVFNPKTNLSAAEKTEMIQTSHLYGKDTSSTFSSRTTVALKVVARSG